MAKRKYVKENNLVKAINTDSLELQKPLVNEYYDINVHNSNMDKIDAGYRQNKNDISNINYELSKTENTKYSTENGVKEFSCKDGYVDNVVIEGETLVNLADFDVSRANSDGTTIRTYFKNPSRVSNGTYTIFNNSDKTFYCVTSSISDNSYLGGYHIEPNSKRVLTFNSDTQCYGIDFGITQYGWVNDTTWYTNDNVKAIILEGDHTDKPISYFEGLKSVGQGDKIEVIDFLNNSYKKIDLANVEWVDKAHLNHNNVIEIADSLKGYSYTNTYIPIEFKVGQSLVIENGNPNICFYDVNKNFINHKLPYYTSDVRFSIAPIPPNAKYFRFTNFLSKKDMVLCYVSNVDKKQISTTLRSLPNGVKDTIEKRGNKYVKVQRCGEITLNGSEGWIEHFSINRTNTLVFASTITRVNTEVETTKIVSDKFNAVKSNGFNLLDVECISNGKDNNYQLMVRINKTKLSAQTVDAFKTWLKSNPITVVYELETPQIIELPNFNPQTYSDNTTLLLNTGVIQGECEFEVTNSKGSEIEVIKYKLSSIDSQISESILALKELGGIL